MQGYFQGWAACRRPHLCNMCSRYILQPERLHAIVDGLLQTHHHHHHHTEKLSARKVAAHDGVATTQSSEFLIGRQKKRRLERGGVYRTLELSDEPAVCSLLAPTSAHDGFGVGISRPLAPAHARESKGHCSCRPTARSSNATQYEPYFTGVNFFSRSTCSGCRNTFCSLIMSIKGGHFTAKPRCRASGPTEPHNVQCKRDASAPRYAPVFSSCNTYTAGSCRSRCDARTSIGRPCRRRSAAAFPSVILRPSVWKHVEDAEQHRGIDRHLQVICRTFRAPASSS